MHTSPAFFVSSCLAGLLLALSSLAAIGCGNDAGSSVVGSGGRIQSGGHGGEGEDDMAESGGAGGTRVDGETGGASGSTGSSRASGGSDDGGGGPACRTETDAPPPEGRCRDSSECTFGALCQTTPPGDGPGCGGACFPVQNDCSTDEGCGENGICVPVPEENECACNSERFVCRAACSAESCSEDEVCGDSGRCEPKPCDQGFSCKENFVCSPERAGADAHGCARARCAEDGFVCAEGSVCDAGSRADGHGCTPIHCTEGPPCPDGKECVRSSFEDSRGCSPLSCERGYSCPFTHDCSPGSNHSHNCAPRVCESDAVCGCGYCVEGTCQWMLRYCGAPPRP